jgi:hypothetical protein
MAGDDWAEPDRRRTWPRWLVYLLLLGLYLTLRGYHSFDGDQAYRLPLLLHRQNPQLYSDDPFVLAFDAFNPHRGALFVLDVLSRPLGLSAGLFVLFAFTFFATCQGIDRLARSAWPTLGDRVGLVAVGLVLAAKAGNVGTNHLFEAMVLDRLIAFGLGWLALAQMVTGAPGHAWRAPGAIGVATLIHPSVGLQLAIFCSACWLVWSLLGRWSGVQFMPGPSLARSDIALSRVPKGQRHTSPGQRPGRKAWIKQTTSPERATEKGCVALSGLGVFWGIQIPRVLPCAGLLRPFQSQIGNGATSKPALRNPTAIWGSVGLMAAVLPGLAVNFAQSSSVTSDIPADTFWLLSVELQSPQHMLPHLWRMPQWLAWSSYMALAGLACASAKWDRRIHCRLSLRERAFLILPQRERQPSDVDSQAPWPAARFRLVIALAMILAGLAVAWFFIEIRHSARVTVFQPFRMATVARGVTLILVAGRVVDLWRRRIWLGRMRAIVLAVGFIGDWLLVVVTLAELAVSAAEAIRSRIPWAKSWNFADIAVWLGMIALGLNFLGHHDTEYGHVPLLSALGTGALVAIVERRGQKKHRSSRCWKWEWTPLRIEGATALAWAIPLAAFLAAAVPSVHPLSRHSVVAGLLNRCRFVQVPVDDMERLALWCQENTSRSARFIGPPGPKTFRLWSQRSLAFNRSASPYHAAGLADWYARFQDHVDFHGAPAEFVRTYVKDRHRFEARYEALSDAQRAALAVRQGANYVIAAAPVGPGVKQSAPLDLLHVEGRYAVYRVKPDVLVQRQE